MTAHKRGMTARVLAVNAHALWCWLTKSELWRRPGGGANIARGSRPRSRARAMQIPHPAVGTARRFQVPRSRRQSSVMIQALTNHNPDVIVVDELSDAADVEAARSICHRGITLVATAHATSLANLLSNSQLNPVLGGLKDVTLSREEVAQLAKEKQGSGSAGGAHSARHAFARSVGSRTRVERRQPPCFQVVIEIVSPTAWRVHWNAAESIDALLVGDRPPSELRVMHEGRLLSRDETVDP